MEIVAGEKDFDTSLRRALNEIDPEWPFYRGLIVVGSHTPEDIEHKLAKIQMAREVGKPFLGICLGHQLAAIEYARNVLGITDATSEEFGQGGTFVVRKRDVLKVGLHEGESWWSQYDVIPEVLAKWDKKPNFFTVPYHPEYGSTIDNPHPILVQFLHAAKNRS